MNFPNLYVARKKKKESISKVAEALHISRQAYSNKERGLSDFTLPEAKQLAKRYGMTVDDLFKEIS